MTSFNTNNTSMKGLFFIIKGQYNRDLKHPDNHLLGYDPYSPNTTEWYMALDRNTFKCVCCSGDLEKVLQGVYKTIKRHRGDISRYYRAVSQSCSVVSEKMKEIYSQVYNEYGDYYEDEIKEIEDLAYGDLREESPLFKSQKLMAKHQQHQGVHTTPVKAKAHTLTPKVITKRVTAIRKLVVV